MTRRVAVMQPYFLPYLGYWRLLAAVDTFVILDDVRFIKGGWINRNRIESRGVVSWLTIPVRGASPNKRIDELQIAQDVGWRRRLRGGLHHAYARAAYREEMMPRVDCMLDRAEGSLTDFLTMTIRHVAQLLGLRTQVLSSRELAVGAGMTGQDRVLALCEALGADQYVNAPGGTHLYDEQTFARRGLELSFLPTLEQHPPADPVARRWCHLSVLQLLMYVPPAVAAQVVADHGRPR